MHNEQYEFQITTSLTKQRIEENDQSITENLIFLEFKWDFVELIVNYKHNTYAWAQRKCNIY